MKQVEKDVVVAGGGLSGVCAALAAARCGASVLLVSNRPVLGGNSSSEIRVWTRGATGGGNLFAEEMGILGELKLRNAEMNPEGNVILWDEVLLEAVTAEENICLLLNTHVTHAAVKDGAIEYLTALQLDSELSYQCSGKMYIDCTGDGSVAAQAGIPYHVGQESCAQYGEKYAPEHETSDTLGSSLFFYTRREDHPVRFVPPRYAYPREVIEGIVDKGGRLINERQTGCDYWWFEYGGERDTIGDAQEIAFELKKLVYGVWNYVKNSGRFPAENLTLEWVGSLAGKRESRRMDSAYILTVNDVLAGRSFADNGFYGGWFLDYHPAKGTLTEERSTVQVPVGLYAVPLRCLFHPACANLVYAGRIIGTTHAAFASARIMNTCALSGQAAGTLAAFCAASGRPPAAEVQQNIEALQTRLAKDDMLILGRRGTDPEDRAQQACVTASSYYQVRDEGKAGSLALAQEVFLCIPQQPGTAETTVRLFADSRSNTTLQAELSASGQPSRLVPGEALGSAVLAVRRGEAVPVTLHLPAAPCARFVLVRFAPADGVFLHSAPFAPTGFLMGHSCSMDHLYPRIQMPSGELYAPSQVVNGYNRPHGGPNLWVAGWEERPWLQLEWEEPILLHCVRLYLNPDLSREWPSSHAKTWDPSHVMAKELGVRSPCLARRLTLLARVEGRWLPVGQVRENWKRVVDLPLPVPVQTSKLRVEVWASEQAPAQIFEVRVY